MDIEKELKEVAADVIAAQPDKKKKSPAGRKNKGITKRSREEYKEEYTAYKTGLARAAAADNFDNNIIERVAGEVVGADDLQSFRDCYALTCLDIWDKFKEENSDLIKKHPYNFYKPLLLEIKKNVPRVGPEDIEKLDVIWDCLRDFLYMIGLYPTFETFSLMTNIYKYQIEDRQELSPKYAAFLKKIFTESKSALLGELSNNPYNQTNKIFLAKAVYNMSEAGNTSHIEINHNIRNIDSLPMFRAGDDL